MTAVGPGHCVMLGRTIGIAMVVDPLEELLVVAETEDDVVLDAKDGELTTVLNVELLLLDGELGIGLIDDGVVDGGKVAGNEAVPEVVLVGRILGVVAVGRILGVVAIPEIVGLVCEGVVSVVVVGEIIGTVVNVVIVEGIAVLVLCGLLGVVLGAGVAVDAVVDVVARDGIPDIGVDGVVKATEAVVVMVV